MNVIVILTDSMRADHLGCHPLCTSHAGKKVETPNLDRLAARGTLFENAYAGSMPTIPMRWDCWTGQWGFPFHRWGPFPEEEYLLAEALWDRGYTSALVTDCYHMHKPSYNNARGFDNVFWVRGQEYDPWIREGDVRNAFDRWYRLKDSEPQKSARNKPNFEQYLRNRSTWKEGGDCFTARVVEEAIHWLDRTVNTKGQKDNLFLWVDCFDPHEPWDPPEPYWSMYAEKPDDQVQPIIDPVPGTVEGYMTDEEVRRTFSLYAGEVTCVDKWVGDLLGTVESLGIDDHTMIVHISDHGESFAEHGVIRKSDPRCFEELSHIPWIIRHPEGVGAGARVTSFVQPADLMPTILDALDIELPLVTPKKHPHANEEWRMQGESLLPLMAGEKEKVRDYAYSCIAERWSIRSDKWAYLMPTDPEEYRTEGPRLYDRTNDLAEQNNVVETHADVAAGIEAKLRAWASRDRE